MATLIPPQVDATALDQETLETRLFELIDSVFPTWTERDRTNFGNVLLGLFAYVGDLLMYYLNRQGDESRFGTVRLRSNMLALIKLVGYKARSRTASTADVDVTLENGPLAGDVVIPSGTVVETPGGSAAIRFQTLIPYSISAGAVDVTISVENSESRVEQFISSGVADQELPPLQSGPYLDQTAVVTASDGEYTEVDDFLGSGSEDRHYTVDVDEFDRARIRFGDGDRGTIPVGDITVEYRIGGGSSGRVDAGSLTKIVGQFADTLDTAAELSATNPNPSSEAGDRESVDEIRIQAPASIRAPNRTVAREDFETRAYETGRVSRALMLTSNEDAGIDENAGVLYIVGLGGAEPTTDDIDTVVAAIATKPPTLTFRLDVNAATFLDVAVSTVVHLEQGADPSIVKADVTAALQDYFAAERSATRVAERRRQVDFGYYLGASLETDEAAIPLSDIETEVLSATGVRKIDDRADGITMNGVREDLVVPLNRFPRLTSVTVIDITSGPIP